MNPMIYSCPLDACVQCGDMDMALEYFKQMEELDFVDVVSYAWNSGFYKCLLDFCVQGGDMGTALRYFEPMQKLDSTARPGVPARGGVSY